MAKEPTNGDKGTSDGEPKIITEERGSGPRQPVKPANPKPTDGD